MKNSSNNLEQRQQRGRQRHSKGGRGSSDGSRVEQKVR
ncbi:hypothetical protein F383_23956 [Gossypium arboreum]|uniref:Uncharacterized protein n=1 Tax=Gossypium arboreum TaxID=29729 RepID=A0A0B0MLG8_GOSAR|nr:hypothetical protein F383_23956 [Gossypium arboreum]